MKWNILVTGAAGFIGSHTVKRLLDAGHSVVGLDCINDYYPPELKLARLALSGIEKEEAMKWYKFATSKTVGDRYRFIRMNLEDTQPMEMLFANGAFDVVINLGGQAGVRHSITHPLDYVESNVKGFANVLEGCRHNGVKHLIFASSSSVYGLNGNVPFSEHSDVAHPVSLYAATKKSNELMAHAYSQLYDLPVTGVRFFTVYGPWGRPDMSPYLFIDAILHDRPIKVFNHGDMWRDFTYIDDIVESLARLVDILPERNPAWDDKNPDPATSRAPYRIYNIGNQRPTRLMDYISCIEKATGREARKEFLPMQPGDVYQTYADSSALAEATGFRPDTDLQEGINRTVEWFRRYFNID